MSDCVVNICEINEPAYPCPACRATTCEVLASDKDSTNVRCARCGMERLIVHPTADRPAHVEIGPFVIMTGKPQKLMTSSGLSMKEVWWMLVACAVGLLALLGLTLAPALIWKP